MFITVLGKHVSILTESSSGPSKKIDPNKVSFCLTDTSLYIYICVTHFGMANIKFVASQAKTTNLYKKKGLKMIL